MIREKSCGAVVSRMTDQGRRFMIIRQKKGHWGLPKGHMEKGETEADTALREIREETGVIADLDTSFRYVISYTLPDGVRKDVVFFAAGCADSRTHAQPEEIAEILWLSYEDAIKRVTYENTRKVIEEANRYFTSKQRPPEPPAGTRPL